MQPGVLISIGIALLGLCLSAHTKLAVSDTYTLLFDALFWGSGAAGVVFLVAGLFRTIFPPSPIRPDIDLREFIDLWLGYSRWSYHNNTFLAAEIMAGTDAALTAMAAEARLDHVTVWGSKDTLFQGVVPLSPIPKEQWDHLSVDSLDFLTADDTKDVVAKPNRAQDSRYIDIHLNRAQVLRQWPRTLWYNRARRRFTLWRAGF
ncbi:hypothetical protein [Reyranella sp.]|uniref:hypothetical protein n=1 Tax=Reyranella sp. TaxID=1929291 RepID=UPI003BAA6DF1